jgi:hypothetical protein
LRRFREPERQAIEDLGAFYRRVDQAHQGFSCPQSGDCCQLRTTGREPYLWRIEWLLLARRIAERGGRMPEVRADGGCRFLDPAGRRCTVYADRPFGCRTYGCGRAEGLTRGLREEVRLFTRELSGLAEQFDPEDGGPRALTRWFEEKV